MQVRFLHPVDRTAFSLALRLGIVYSICYLWEHLFCFTAPLLIGNDTKRRITHLLTFWCKRHFHVQTLVARKTIFLHKAVIFLGNRV